MPKGAKRGPIGGHMRQVILRYLASSTSIIKKESIERERLKTIFETKSESICLYPLKWAPLLLRFFISLNYMIALLRNDQRPCILMTNSDA